MKNVNMLTLKFVALCTIAQSYCMYTKLEEEDSISLKLTLKRYQYTYNKELDKSVLLEFYASKRPATFYNFFVDKLLAFDEEKKIPETYRIKQYKTIVSSNNKDIANHTPNDIKKLIGTKAHEDVLFLFWKQTHKEEFNTNDKKRLINICKEYHLQIAEHVYKPSEFEYLCFSCFPACVSTDLLERFSVYEHYLNTIKIIN